MTTLLQLTPDFLIDRSVRNKIVCVSRNGTLVNITVKEDAGYEHFAVTCMTEIEAMKLLADLRYPLPQENSEDLDLDLCQQFFDKVLSDRPRMTIREITHGIKEAVKGAQSSKQEEQ